MAEGHPLGPQRVLGLGSAQARSEGRGERDRVDGDAAHPPQVEGDHPLVGTRERLDATDDAGPAAERDHGDPLAFAYLEQRRDLIAAAGHHDCVRSGA